MILRSIFYVDDEDIQVLPVTKTLVIELEQDDEFFQMLMRELNQITSVQEVAKTKFEKDVSDLEHRLNALVRFGIDTSDCCSETLLRRCSKRQVLL